MPQEVIDPKQVQRQIAEQLQKLNNIIEQIDSYNPATAQELRWIHDDLEQLTTTRSEIIAGLELLLSEARTEPRGSGS